MENVFPSVLEAGTPSIVPTVCWREPVVAAVGVICPFIISDTNIVGRLWNRIGLSFGIVLFIVNGRENFTL